LNLTPGAFSLTSISFAPFVAFTTPLTSHHSTKLPLTKLPSFPLLSILWLHPTIFAFHCLQED
jgi:hypothetical protein